MITRRRFLQLTSSGLLAAPFAPLIGCDPDEQRPLQGEARPTAPLSSPDTEPGAPLPRHFYIALLADTHIIDEFHSGGTGSLDRDTLFLTSERLDQARDMIHGLPWPVERVFVAGDIVHNLPWSEYDSYFEHRNRFDIVAEHFASFAMPVHPAFGNHDYSLGRLPRALSHDLFREKLGTEAYEAHTIRGWKFINLNNFLGDTMDSTSPVFNTDIGSFGEEQLQWLEGELQEGRPTFIFFHYPLWIIAEREVADLGLVTLLRRHRDTIRYVGAGHSHIWVNNGNTYGPPHMVVASTRYDPQSFLIFEIDTHLDTWRILNWEHLHWGTHYTAPWATLAQSGKRSAA